MPLAMMSLIVSGPREEIALLAGCLEALPKKSVIALHLNLILFGIKLSQVGAGVNLEIQIRGWSLPCQPPCGRHSSVCHSCVAWEGLQAATSSR
jgi:hypothetical protein